MVKMANLVKMAKSDQPDQLGLMVRKGRRETAASLSFKCISMLLKVMSI